MVVCGSRELNKRRCLTQEILSTDHFTFPVVCHQRRRHYAGIGHLFQTESTKVNLRGGRQKTTEIGHSLNQSRPPRRGTALVLSNYLDVPIRCRSALTTPVNDSLTASASPAGAVSLGHSQNQNRPLLRGTVFGLVNCNDPLWDIPKRGKAPTGTTPCPASGVWIRAASAQLPLRWGRFFATYGNERGRQLRRPLWSILLFRF
jgi:hypothetical protein